MCHTTSMKAMCLFDEKFEMAREDGRVIVVCMDLYKVPEGETTGLPNGYRFSWIAYDPDKTQNRVLFDCHSPKGPHFHLDDEKEGTPYHWVGLVEAERYFFEVVEGHFGKLIGGNKS